MTGLFSRIVRDTSGATAIEYALIASLISIGAVVAMTALGQSLQSFFFGPVSQSLLNALAS
jgi:pilus assembly protein Flp/PilA